MTWTWVKGWWRIMKKRKEKRVKEITEWETDREKKRVVREGCLTMKMGEKGDFKGKRKKSGFRGMKVSSSLSLSILFSVSLISSSLLTWNGISTTTTSFPPPARFLHHHWSLLSTIFSFTCFSLSLSESLCWSGYDHLDYWSIHSFSLSLSLILNPLLLQLKYKPCH